MTEVRPGDLLVAAPTLLDPNFADSVVLMLDTETEGALGVVINRPSAVLVAEVLGDWRDVVTEPEVLYLGGPVSTDGAIAIGRLAEGAALADAPVGWRPVEAPDNWGLGIIDLDAPVELIDGSLSQLRIYAGYAGWGVGQLEAEIEEGAWYVVPSLPDDAFRADPTTLRRDVLRRQPGELAWVSTKPIDPGLN